jgi:RHS repeat-associated protein
VQGAGTIGGLVQASLDGTNVFYVYDGNGNVMRLVDDTGTNIVASYTYDPYGNLIAQSGRMASANPYRFSTKYFDTETGLYYYGYRYYHPEMGRWVSRDPIQEAGGLNLYGYVQNGPVSNLDRLGLATFINSSTADFIVLASMDNMKWKAGDCCCKTKKKDKLSAIPTILPSAATSGPEEGHMNVVRTWLGCFTSGRPRSYKYDPDFVVSLSDASSADVYKGAGSDTVTITGSGTLITDFIYDGSPPAAGSVHPPMTGLVPQAAAYTSHAGMPPHIDNTLKNLIKLRDEIVAEKPCRAINHELISKLSALIADVTALKSALAP